MKTLSLVGAILMVVGLVTLWIRRELISGAPTVIALQIAAAALMLWARVTFGMRSFHAAADPTEGGLVRSGPYRYVRHPIYTSVCLFTWAGVAAHASPVSIALGMVTTAGAVMRMLVEERLLIGRYPEYVAYARDTKRMIPFVY